MPDIKYKRNRREITPGGFWVLQFHASALHSRRKNSVSAAEFLIMSFMPISFVYLSYFFDFDAKTRDENTIPPSPHLSYK
ncbi:hypothetical protein IMSAG025_01317 [Muribaculaceae bacterium]|nr:hypothetical protein IMSAG025_01317 [Muribaculaceae bacterium]